MPKPSLLKKDNAAGAGFGFGEGRGRILDLKCVAHQFQASKKTGEQQPPGCFLFVTIDRTDADGKSLGEDPTTDELKIGDLENFHPGIMKNPTDDEPEDLGTDLGTEGNSIWADGTKKFGQSAKGKVFLDSIEEAGFRADVIARCYLPDYVGMLADFAQATVTPTGGTRKIDPYQVLTVKEILEFPYDLKTKSVTAGKAAGGTGNTAKTSTTKATAVKEPETVAAANGDAGDAEEIATAFLSSMLEGWSGKTHNIAKLTARSFTYCGKMTPPAPPKLQTAVGRLLGNIEWVAAAGGPMGITVEGTEVTFPAED